MLVFFSSNLKDLMIYQTVIPKLLSFLTILTDFFQNSWEIEVSEFGIGVSLGPQTSLNENTVYLNCLAKFELHH